MVSHFRSITAALTVLIGAFSPPFTSSAQQYEDPAIAICEFVKLHEQTRDPSYQRLSGDIHKQTASIIYEMSVLNLAPTTQIAECRYSLSEGGYQLDLAETELERACVEARDGGRQLATQLDLGPEEMIVVTIMCEPHLKAISEREQDLEPLLRQIRSAGVYPIAPSTTALSENQK